MKCWTAQNTCRLRVVIMYIYWLLVIWNMRVISTIIFFIFDTRNGEYANIPWRVIESIFRKTLPLPPRCCILRFLRPISSPRRHISSRNSSLMLPRPAPNNNSSRHQLGTDQVDILKKCLEVEENVGSVTNSHTTPALSISISFSYQPQFSFHGLQNYCSP